MSRRFERVYTVADWYDGPRSGAADFDGHPHFYRSIYLDSETWNPDEDRFELTPITENLLACMLEAQELHERWNNAYRSGQVLEGKYDEPRVLLEDRERYEELEQQIAATLEGSRPTLIARGEFALASKEVRWTPVGERPEFPSEA